MHRRHSAQSMAKRLCSVKQALVLVGMLVSTSPSVSFLLLLNICPCSLNPNTASILISEHRLPGYWRWWDNHHSWEPHSWFGAVLPGQHSLASQWLAGRRGRVSYCLYWGNHLCTNIFLGRRKWRGGLGHALQHSFNCCILKPELKCVGFQGSQLLHS